MRSVFAIAVVVGVLAGCYVGPYHDHRYPPYDDRPSYAPPPAYDDRDLPTIVCASKDGRPTQCPTGFPIKGAELDKRYSGSPCEYGRTWGYERGQVWVDRGCRARFRLYPAGRWR